MYVFLRSGFGISKTEKYWVEPENKLVDLLRKIEDVYCKTLLFNGKLLNELDRTLFSYGIQDCSTIIYSTKMPRMWCYQSKVASCCVCMETKKDHSLIFPCFHFETCTSCTSKLKNDRCPECNQKFYWTDSCNNKPDSN